MTFLPVTSRAEQNYYLENYGTRDDWYREFGKFYDDRLNEKVWFNDDIHNK